MPCDCLSVSYCHQSFQSRLRISFVSYFGRNYEYALAYTLAVHAPYPLYCHQYNLRLTSEASPKFGQPDSLPECGSLLMHYKQDTYRLAPSRLELDMNYMCKKGQQDANYRNKLQKKLIHSSLDLYAAISFIILEMLTIMNQHHLKTIYTNLTHSIFNSVFQ